MGTTETLKTRKGAQAILLVASTAMNHQKRKSPVTSDGELFEGPLGTLCIQLGS